MAVQAIVQKFDQMMYADTNIYGFAILSGDGRNVVSKAEKKSRTGVMKIDEKTRDILEECKESYPFVKWVSGESLDVGMTEALYCMVNRPVLLGIVALGEAEKTEEDSYLCVALDEKKVSQSYGMVSYNGSRAALVDENGKIISSTDSEYLETIYQPKEEEQNIEYDLSYHNWKLVNMIPKDEHLREARGIKTGFLCGIASYGAVFLSDLEQGHIRLDPDSDGSDGDGGKGAAGYRKSREGGLAGAGEGQRRTSGAPVSDQPALSL